MHLLSAHAALSIAVSFVVFVVLGLVGLHVLLGLAIALVAGPVVVYLLIPGVADRLEHWMTTMR